jgi:hypothetical protein
MNEKARKAPAPAIPGVMPEKPDDEAREALANTLIAGTDLAIAVCCRTVCCAEIKTFIFKLEPRTPENPEMHAAWGPKDLGAAFHTLALHISENMIAHMTGQPEPNESVSIVEIDGDKHTIEKMSDAEYEARLAKRRH